MKLYSMLLTILTASAVAAFADVTIPGPHELPDPDGSFGSTDKPVKVYILSGQSNMVGEGVISKIDEDTLEEMPGTLKTLTLTDGLFPHLIDASNNWTVRNDVMYRGVITAIGNGPLTPGVMGSKIGPEMGFGHIMGYFHDEPVIVLKTSQGNRSISWDYAPPSTERFTWFDGATDWTYAAYGETPGRWETGRTSEPISWYAGLQYDQCFTDEAEWSTTARALGFGSVFSVTDILDNFALQYPQYAAQGFEIAGYGWWQGHKDQYEPMASRYELNMVNLINDLRRYYEKRYPDNCIPDAPFVIATIAFGGWDLAEPGLSVANGQLAVSGETGNYPDFEGNVKTVEARGFWRDSSVSPTTLGYHYNGNAETFMLVGDAMGMAMAEMITPYFVDAGENMVTWSGEPVHLDATVEEGVTVTSYYWTAEPADGVVFTPNDGGDGSTCSVEDPMVTITKAVGDPVTVAIKLTVNDGINPPVSNTITIDVYDTGCDATIGEGMKMPYDFDEDCEIGLGDLAVVIEKWLTSTASPGPVIK